MQQLGLGVATVLALCVAAGVALDRDLVPPFDCVGIVIFIPIEANVHVAKLDHDWGSAAITVVDVTRDGARPVAARSKVLLLIVEPAQLPGLGIVAAGLYCK